MLLGMELVVSIDNIRKKASKQASKQTNTPKKKKLIHSAFRWGWGVGGWGVENV